MMKDKQNTVIYVSSTLPEELYTSVVDKKDKTDQQAQKFHRAMIEGFLSNSFKIIPVSYRARTFKKNIQYDSNIRYHIIGCKQIKVLYFLILIKTFYTVNKLIKKNKNAIIITDILNLSISLGALLAAIVNKNTSIGIITDVPGIYDKPGIKRIINRWIINLFNKYIFLTEQMNVLLNKKNKIYSILEGIYCEINFKDKNKIKINSEKFNIVYAGTLDEVYGISSLISAMEYIKSDDINLHIFGFGDYMDNIIKVSAKDKRINYYGVRDNQEVMNIEKQANLLINPRSKNEKFTEYSFPSKTIEYMSTGVPILMQKLPGIPKEYLDYIFFYEGDNGKELANAIEKLYKKKDELREKGIRAQKFIKTKKTSKVQIARIIKELRLI